MSFITHYFHIILHLDMYLTLLIKQLGPWIYTFLFLIIFCESGFILTPILPGESLLFAVGSLAARNAFNLTLLISILILAAILGGVFNYFLGLYIGKRLLNSQKQTTFHKYLEQTHAFYNKHGGLTIILARFLPIIRTYAPFVAGIAKMNVIKFSIYNVFGGVLWISLFIYSSYFFGNLPLIKDNFSFVILGIVIISIIPATFEFIRFKFFKKRTKSCCHSQNHQGMS